MHQSSPGGVAARPAAIMRYTSPNSATVEPSRRSSPVARVQFGWNSPVIGVPESGGQPIVMQELDQVLPVVAQHFDTVWAPDHFYGFDRIDDPFLECWTTLTWLAATFPQLKVGGLV